MKHKRLKFSCSYCLVIVFSVKESHVFISLSYSENETDLDNINIKDYM